MDRTINSVRLRINCFKFTDDGCVILKMIAVTILTKMKRPVLDVTDHVLVTNLLALSLGELVPDVHPVTVVLVDALATNLNLGVLDKIVAEVVEPAELGTIRDSDLGDGDLEVDTREKITIAGDGACHALAEIGGTVEGLLDGLHREIGMSTIHDLKEGDLGIASKVDVLCTIRDELH